MVCAILGQEKSWSSIFRPSLLCPLFGPVAVSRSLWCGVTVCDRFKVALAVFQANGRFKPVGLGLWFGPRFRLGRVDRPRLSIKQISKRLILFNLTGPVNNISRSCLAILGSSRNGVTLGALWSCSSKFVFQFCT